MEERNIRTAMLIGADALDKLKSAKVAVFGIGGVGGHAIDALVRAGIGAIDIIDSDRVSESNINRQIIANYSTLGMLKTDAMEAHIKSINPHCEVVKHPVFFSPETVGNFNFGEYSYVIDAIDNVTGKIILAEKCLEAKTPLIAAMGTGNKLSPLSFEVTDIYKTSGCPLARVMRNELRKRGIPSLKVVYSRESARTPIEIEGISRETKKVPPASISFVPSVAGLILASEVIKCIAVIQN